MSIHQQNKNREPDSNFTKGDFSLLFPSNRCRLLDGRRTPGFIEEYFEQCGIFRWRITDFEDKGKYWDVDAERVSRYQFALDSKKLSQANALEIENRCKLMNKKLHISPQPEAKKETLKKISVLQNEATAWLKENSEFLKSGEKIEFLNRKGPGKAAKDMLRYMDDIAFGDMERKTAEIVVMNPFSGEWVKGMEIVLAKMGLCEYHGKVPRTDDIFSGRGNEKVRKDYLLRRLAFIRALFAAIDISEVVLFKGMSAEGPWRETDPKTFTSWTFSLNVAKSFSSEAFESDFKHGYFLKRTFPIEKLFMTCIETASMNSQYLEAEALVMHEENDRLLW